MMHHPPATDRRSFLKTGAVIAAPVALALPAAAHADDGMAARLTRLEDEREIERLRRTFLRRFNGSADCSGLTASADAVDFQPALRCIAEDPVDDGSLELSEDGRSATSQHACFVELENEFMGDSTIERMARFQGQGSARHSERREMRTSYIKAEGGWRIARLVIA